MSGEQHVPKPLDVDAIEARAAEASPGPWWKSSGITYVHGADGDVVASIAAHRDWDFVAHSRADVPALIAEVRALREARALPDRETIARTLAATDDENDCFDEVDAWNALEEWEREAHPDDEPMMEREDCEYYLRRADAVLALFGQEGQR